jgi:sulfite exporter TauE/SafE
MDAFRLVVYVLLGAIVSSLGIGLYHLSSGRGDSQKMLRALTYRIALSLLLFVLLMVAWRLGWISPHSYSH